MSLSLGVLVYKMSPPGNGRTCFPQQAGEFSDVKPGTARSCVGSTAKAQRSHNVTSCRCLITHVLIMTLSSFPYLAGKNYFVQVSHIFSAFEKPTARGPRTPEAWQMEHHPHPKASSPGLKAPLGTMPALPGGHTPSLVGGQPVHLGTNAGSAAARNPRPAPGEAPDLPGGVGNTESWAPTPELNTGVYTGSEAGSQHRGAAQPSPGRAGSLSLGVKCPRPGPRGVWPGRDQVTASLTVLDKPHLGYPPFAPSSLPFLLLRP